MKKLVIVFLTVVFFQAPNLFSQTLVSGDITGTWSPANSPYIVTGNINVVDSLIIEPGVTVQFQAGGLQIAAGSDAKFVSAGTDDNEIIFEPFNGTSPGSYEGIILTGSGVDDIFEYCTIRYATTGIFVTDCTPKINKCTIYGNSVYGIYSRVMSGHYSSKITNCHLFDNWDSGIRVMGYDRYGEASDTVYIEHCTIYNNGQNGILVYSGTYWNWGVAYMLARISNCTLFNNPTGVRAYAYRGYADANIINTIFAFNSGYGIANQDSRSFIGSNDIIYNCFWYNTSGNFTSDISGTGFGQNGPYQNSNNDSCDINFNIYNDPLFVDTASHNFHLQTGSKCINAGTPVIFNQYVMDPDDTFPEIGAYYYEGSTSVFQHSVSKSNDKIKLSQNYPNPFSHSTSLEYYIPFSDLVKVSIYNTTGEIIWYINLGYQSAGEHNIEWDGINNIGERVSSGYYFCKVTTSYSSKVQKMALIR